MNTDMKINKISDWVWEIPKSEKEGMRVPARIYASDVLFENMDKVSLSRLQMLHVCPVSRNMHSVCLTAIGDTGFLLAV